MLGDFRIRWWGTPRHLVTRWWGIPRHLCRWTSLEECSSPASCVWEIQRMRLSDSGKWMLNNISTCDTLESGLRRASMHGWAVGTRCSVTGSVSATRMDNQESTCVIVSIVGTCWLALLVSVEGAIAPALADLVDRNTTYWTGPLLSGWWMKIVDTSLLTLVSHWTVGIRWFHWFQTVPVNMLAN